jgi:hypothetical protein
MILEFRSRPPRDVQKRASSPSDLRRQPSAMFAPIEAAARRICEVNPNNSSLGNARVAL